MLAHLLMLLIASTGAAQVLGTWRLVGTPTSGGTAAPLPKNMTVRYEARGEAEIWTIYRVRMDGLSETTSQFLRFDGKEYPCGGIGFEDQPDGVISRRLGDREVEVTYKRAGRPTRRIVRTISADGRRMTLAIFNMPPTDPSLDQRLEFEK